MTKSKFEELKTAIEEGRLYGYLFESEHCLGEFDLGIIAREMAYLLQMADQLWNSTVNTSQALIKGIQDFYETFGWDEE